MSGRIVDSILNLFSSPLSGHKHSWEKISQTEEEIDQGIGMAPIVQVEMKCSRCGKNAIKTIHPLYGTVIEEIPLPEFDTPVADLPELVEQNGLLATKISH
jgi:hypothetical protein